MAVTHSRRQEFLENYDREHTITMRVLRAYPTDKLDLRPHPKLKTARELAWVFVIERGLGMKVWRDEFAKGFKGGSAPPSPPEKFEDILVALEKSHNEFRNTIANASEEELVGQTHFFTGPKTLGEVGRLQFAWFLLSDEIHHRGQFSIYLRMAGAKVPSIYGPTADEPWI